MQTTELLQDLEEFARAHINSDHGCGSKPDIDFELNSDIRVKIITCEGGTKFIINLSCPGVPTLRWPGTNPPQECQTSNLTIESLQKKYNSFSVQELLERYDVMSEFKGLCKCMAHQLDSNLVLEFDLAEPTWLPRVNDFFIDYHKNDSDMHKSIINANFENLPALAQLVFAKSAEVASVIGI